MRRQSILRAERWLSLLELANLMKLEQASKAARRRAALRVVRMAEHVNQTRISKRVGNKVYVSTVRMELLFPVNDERIFNIESALIDINQKHKGLNRQVQNHGARLGKVERQQELTRKFLADWTSLE